MKLPALFKIADIEDRIGYFDESLAGMRAAAKKEDFMSGEQNPHYRPLDIGAYRKILLHNINDYQAKEVAENTEDYNNQLARHQRGEKESSFEIMAPAAALGIAGGALGSMAGRVIGGLVSPHRYRRAGAGIGAVLGGAGLGLAGFLTPKPFREPRPISHPGELSDYLAKHRDNQAEEARIAFSNPITSEDDLNDTIRYFALEDEIIYEKTACPLIIKRAAQQPTPAGNTPDGEKPSILMSIIGGNLISGALRTPAQLAARRLGGSITNTPLLPGEADLADQLFRKFSPGVAGIGDTADAAEHMTRKFPEAIREGAKKAIEAKLNLAGPHYNPSTKMIYNVGESGAKTFGDTLSRSPGIIGHELGHALNHKMFGKLYPAIMGVGRYSMLGAVPIGIMGYLRHRDSDRGKANKWRNASLAAAGTGSALTLLDEGSASIRAMKMLKSLNPGKAILSANRSKLGRAFGTYAALGTIPLALAGGAYALDARAHKRNQKEDSVIKESSLKKLALSPNIALLPKKWWGYVSGKTLRNTEAATNKLNSLYNTNLRRHATTLREVQKSNIGIRDATQRIEALRDAIKSNPILADKGKHFNHTYDILNKELLYHTNRADRAWKLNWKAAINMPYPEEIEEASRSLLNAKRATRNYRVGTAIVGAPLVLGGAYALDARAHKRNQKEDSVIKESSFGKRSEQVIHKYAAAKNDEDTAPFALLGNKITSPALTSYPRGETPPPMIGMGGANLTYDWSRTTPKQLVLPKGRKIVGALALAAGAGITGLGLAGKEPAALLAGIGAGLYGASRFIPSAEGRAAKRLLKNNESFSNSDTHDLYRGKFKSLGM